MKSALNLICSFQEMAQPLSKAIDKIDPYSLGVQEHLGKIYTTSSKSNWYGTIYGQVKNIQKVVFNDSPSQKKYFRYIWTLPISSNMPDPRTPVGQSLNYKRYSFNDADYKILHELSLSFFGWLSGKLTLGEWPAMKDDIDVELDKFKNSK